MATISMDSSRVVVLDIRCAAWLPTVEVMSVSRTHLSERLTRSVVRHPHHHSLKGKQAQEDAQMAQEFALPHMTPPGRLRLEMRAHSLAYMLVRPLMSWLGSGRGNIHGTVIW